METISGISASPGIAIGKAFIYVHESPAVPHRPIPSEAVTSEMGRFEDAARAAVEEIEQIRQRSAQEIDPDLIEAVRRGRREEFNAFGWDADPPDPQDEATFFRSRLNRELLSEARHRSLYQFYKELISLRRNIPALARLDKETLEVLGYDEQQVVFIRRWSDEDEVVMVFALGQLPVSVPVPIPAGRWRTRLDSADTAWCGREGRMPGKLESGGSVALTFRPPAFTLLQRIGET